MRKAVIIPLLLALLLIDTEKAQSTAQSPNILVIMTDDQRADTLEYMPFTSQMGISFTNAFAPTPICCPARAAFLSGKYAHDTDVWRNTDAPNFADDDDNTLPVRLQRAGYSTAWVGKYLNEWVGTPPGWTYFNARPGFHWGDEYHTKAIGREIITWTKTQTTPWFVVASIRAPHTGDDMLPEGYSCPTYPLWRPPSYTLEGQAQQNMDEFRNKQLCSLHLVDAFVRRMVTKLPTDTVIIFLSDQGHHWGEHGEQTKGTFWDEATGFPLVIRYPGMGTRINDALVGMIDLAPTILNFVGLSSEGMTGKSILPLITGEKNAVRSALLLELRGPIYWGEALRTKNLLYIREPQQLYFRRDRWQLDNRAEQEQGRIEKLERIIKREMDK